MLLQMQELQSPLRDGWGICTDGASLIVSDSSPTLAWLDPDTLQQQRTVEVHDGDAQVPWVNEVRARFRFAVLGLSCIVLSAWWQQHIGRCMAVRPVSLANGAALPFQPLSCTTC